jgi:hypothetical protein
MHALSPDPDRGEVAYWTKAICCPGKVLYGRAVSIPDKECQLARQQENLIFYVKNRKRPTLAQLFACFTRYRTATAQTFARIRTLFVPIGLDRSALLEDEASRLCSKRVGLQSFPRRKGCP